MTTLVSPTQRSWLAAALALALAAGCSNSTEDAVDSGTESGTESTGGGSDDGEFIECECVQLDLVCTGLVHQAAQGCYINNPCGVVTAEDGSEAMTECVLGMLMAQETGRFYYSLANEAASETNSGWFYVLGPGSGLETGCYEKANGTTVANANYYEIAEPSYFEGCYGMDARDMTMCMFGGLTLLGDVPSC